MFSAVLKDQLRSFGWYPFTQELADKIQDTVVKVQPWLPYYRLVLKEGCRLIANRQNHMSAGQGTRWTFYMLGMASPDGSTFVMKIDEAGNVEMT